MPQIITVQHNSWESCSLLNLSYSGDDLAVGDFLIIKNEAVEMVEVKTLKKEEKTSNNISSNVSVLRKATQADLKKFNDLNSKEVKKKALIKFREFAKRCKLDMKVVDVFFAYNGGRVTFLFVAEGRVDFRVLVKNLTSEFQKSVRLQQVGARDEAKLKGLYGPCGRPVCCKTFLRELGNVSTDYIRDQGLSHRGNERLSGACGRLMCCLGYELELYRELGANMPRIGEEIKTADGMGRVVDRLVYRQEIRVRLPDRRVMILPWKGKKD